MRRGRRLRRIAGVFAEFRFQFGKARVLFGNVRRQANDLLALPLDESDNCWWQRGQDFRR
jgi:hypothetical protein